MASPAPRDAPAITVSDHLGSRALASRNCAQPSSGKVSLRYTSSLFRRFSMLFASSTSTPAEDLRARVTRARVQRLQLGGPAARRVRGRQRRDRRLVAVGEDDRVIAQL